jgi:hypothetical protein
MQAYDLPDPGTPTAIPTGFSSIIAINARWLSFRCSFELATDEISSSQAAIDLLAGLTPGGTVFRLAMMSFLCLEQKCPG